MIDFSRSRIDMDHTREVPLLSTVSLAAEGLAMQLVLENGMEKCRPSNATDAAIFLGFSWGQPFGAPQTVARTEVLSTDGDGFVTLSRAPTGFADMSMYVGTDYTGTKLTGVATGTPTAAQFVIGPDGRTVATAQPDSLVFAVYRYAPTVGEAAALFGELFPGAGAINTLMKTGLITRAEKLYTDQFDPTVAWGTIVSDATVTAAQTIRGGANGRITAGATGGCDLSKFCHVIEAPSAESPYLGLYVRGA